MKIALLLFGLSGITGVTGGMGYFAMRGTPSMRVFGEGLPMSVRNYSTTYVSAAQRRRSRTMYYGSSSRRHYGGGYSSGK